MTQPSAWRPLPGYVGHYEVSDTGLVRSWKVCRGQSGPRILVPYDNRTGYATVGLFLEGVGRKRLVHQLVLEAFRGPKPAWAECVRHLNGDAQDNRLVNLAYGTNCENAQDAIRHGVHHRANRPSCPNGHPYTAENTARTPSGGRRCRECGRITGRKSYERIKAERALRGPQPRKLKTHCSRGHEFTPDNIRLSSTRPGVRICKACQHEYAVSRWAKSQVATP